VSSIRHNKTILASSRRANCGVSSGWAIRSYYPYLYLDATYLKVRWGARVTSMALLACVGVDEEGFREVLAIEVAGTEKGAAYASLLRVLIDRGLSGVRLVVSDDHEGIKAAVAGELSGAEWQRCTVHFERNVLAHVPNASMAEVGQDLKAIFKVRREKTAEALAEEFVEIYNAELSQGGFGVRGGYRGRSHLIFATPEATMPGYARRTCWRGYSKR
jgi:transposase-like protein